MSQTLPAELDTFVYRGLLLPGDEDDPLVFLQELAESTVRGEVTEQQALALCSMVGIGGADHAAAVARARGVS